MELSTLLLILAILAYPICMGVMMWTMNKNMANHAMQEKFDHSVHAEHIEMNKK